MGRKKKIGSAGRYGNRYGKKARKAVSEIEKLQKQRHICPSCGMPYAKRVAKGIFICRKCGTKFTGMAYYPKLELKKG